MSTWYNGKEISETVYPNVSTRPPPPSEVLSSWMLAVSEADIHFNINLHWVGIRKEYTYQVEIFDSQGKSWDYKTSKDTCVHKTSDPEDVLDVKLWSISANGLMSDACLQQRIASAPKLMRSYVQHLRHKLAKDSKFSKDMNDYIFKVALLQRVSKELKEVQSGLQMAVAMSGSHANADEISDSEVPDDPNDDAQSAELMDVFQH